MTAVVPEFKAILITPNKKSICILTPSAADTSALILPAAQIGATFITQIKYIISTCGHSSAKIALNEVEISGCLLICFLLFLGNSLGNFRIP